MQKLLVIFIGSFFQLVLMIAICVGSARRDLVEAAYTLGASGAMESAWLWQQLQQGILPEIPHPPAYRSLPLAHGAPLADGLYLNYFLGFGGSAAAWLMRWSRP